MKNLKNMLAAASLGAVLMVGTASANTGILLSDSASNNGCTGNDTRIIRLITGILLSDFASTGILLSDSAQPGCGSADSTGILLSD